MDDPILTLAIERYPTGIEAPQKLSGGNFSRVYQIDYDGREAILRLTPPDENLDRDAMEAILAWAYFLVQNGLPVARPLLSVQNLLVETIGTDEETWLASVVEKASGVRAENLPFDRWDDALFQELGRVTGKMHALSSTYLTLDNNPPRPHWNEITNNYHPQIEGLDDLQAVIRQRHCEVLEQIGRLPHSPDGYGLIHGDLQCANFFVDPQTRAITLYDFDDCCMGWFLMDIALPLLDLLVVYPGLEDRIFAERFLRSFLSGYLSEHPLESSWLHELPLFLKLLEIGLYLQVYTFADDCAPESWVGKFMKDRKVNIEKGLPFIALDIDALLLLLPQNFSGKKI